MSKLHEVRENEVAFCADVKLLGAAAFNLNFEQNGAKLIKQILPVAKHLLKEKQLETSDKRLQFRIRKARMGA
jgi:hypothetical protein